MTRQFQVYLDSSVSSVTFCCVHCRAHLADHNNLISKAFQGSQGRAYLFDKVVNVRSSGSEDRLLLTGQHRVADIYCESCNVLLGWKYKRAFEPSQRYKEGKYIIELVHLIKENRWTESYLGCLSSPTSSSSSTSSGYLTGAGLLSSPPLSPPSPADTPDEEGRQRGVAFPMDSLEGIAPVSESSPTSHPERRFAVWSPAEVSSTPTVTFHQTSPQLTDLSPIHSVYLASSPSFDQRSHYEVGSASRRGSLSDTVNRSTLSTGNASTPLFLFTTATPMLDSSLPMSSLSFALEAVQNSLTGSEVFSAALE